MAKKLKMSNCLVASRIIRWTWAGGWQDLRNLKDGWADGTQPADQWGKGYGKAPVAQGLDWLAERLEAGYADDLPRPYIYPTPEGGVSLEWSLGQNEASLEVDLLSHSAEWHCLNLSSGRSTEEDFDLDDDERLGTSGVYDSTIGP